MAKKVNATAKTEAKANRPVESEYKVSELAENAKNLFGMRPECVTAALKAADKATCTVSEARDIVKAFMEREVK